MRTPLFLGSLLMLIGMISCGTTRNSDGINIDSALLVEKYWKLIEINGKMVGAGDGLNREPHFILQSAENRVAGNGSCNSLFGSYQLSSGNRISFSNMGSTKMACPNMEVEQAVFHVFSLAGSFSLDKDTLTLRSVNHEKLARFVKSEK